VSPKIALSLGWLACKLSELVSDISYGYTAKAKGDPVGPRMLRITDIQNNKVDWEQVPYCEIADVLKEQYKLKEGDLLFARTGATVGKSFLIVGTIPEAVFASYLIRVRCIEKELSRYLSYFFRSPLYWTQITDFSAGIGQPNVNGSKLQNLTVPLAPKDEQKRIADKLDAILARVDACRERGDRLSLILKRFRQSVLAAATSGSLTEDWRQEFSEDEWSFSKAENLCEWITKGTTPTKDKMYELHGEIPYIKVYNLCFDGCLDFTMNPTFIDRETHEGTLKRSKVIPGDVLMNIVGPPLGKVSIVPKSYPEWNINQAIALFRPKERIHHKFLAYVLMSEKTITEMIRKSKATAGQFNLTLEVCRSINVPIPSMLEQQEIVRRVETLFAYADRLEARYTAARTHLDRLTPALLAKAFRGELVPQDPNDEPAAVLLERIRAQRQAQGTTKPKRRRSAKPQTE
jgi:type I restriction enzyme S subunit